MRKWRKDLPLEARRGIVTGTGEVHFPKDMENDYGLESFPY